MKAKVFKYKFDGNTVVAPYMELEPYAENVYLSLSTKNEYGNESEDIFHVVCKIENVFSLADSIHADSLTRRNAKKQLPLIVKIGLQIHFKI